MRVSSSLVRRTTSTEDHRGGGVLRPFGGDIRRRFDRNEGWVRCSCGYSLIGCIESSHEEIHRIQGEGLGAGGRGGTCGDDVRVRWRGVHHMLGERQKDVGSTALAVAVDAKALEAGTTEESWPWCCKYVSDEDE